MGGAPIENTSPIPRAAVAPAALLGLAGFAVRALEWPRVFDPGRIVPVGNDAYYHLRRVAWGIENFPSVLHRDPYLNFPDGGEAIWGPLLDFALALLARLSVGSDAAAAERILVWVPPLCGALAVALTFALAARLWGRTAGWIAGGLLAVLPGAASYSTVGYVDHHAAVGLASIGLLMGAIGCVREGTRRGATVGTGLGIAASLLLWPGMALHLGALELGWLVLLLAADAPAAARRIALRLALVHAIAAIGIAPFAVGREWDAWGSFTPVVLTSFQPWALAAAAAAFAIFGAAAGRGPAPLRAGRRAVTALAAGAAVLGASTAFVPDLGEAAGDALRWFAKQEEFQAQVSQSRPLFHNARGRFDPGFAHRNLSGLVYTAPVAWLWLAMRVRRRGVRAAAGDTLVLAHAGVLLGATVVQARFFDSSTAALALLSGAAGAAGLAAVRALPGGRRAGVAAASAIAIGVALAPVAGVLGAQLREAARAWRGETPEIGGHARRKRLLLEVADWIRESTPPTSGYLARDARPEYAVLSAWTDGHLLAYVARRPTVVGNFGDDVGARNMALVDAYYAGDEPPGLAVLDQLGARFAVFEYRRAVHRGFGPDSLRARLYFADGALAATSYAAANGELREVQHPVGAAAGHRLRFETDAKPGSARPGFKIYERVAGARLVGHALPGAEVEASLGLTTNRGRRFVWRDATRADANGRFELAVPYATRDAPGDVVPDGAYRLESGGVEAELAVEESAVRRGGEVAAPDLRRAGSPEPVGARPAPGEESGA